MHKNFSDPTSNLLVDFPNLAAFFGVSSETFPSPSTPYDTLTDGALDNEPKDLLSLIEDPLWKRVCLDAEALMGSFVVSHLWDCHLGTYCSKTKSFLLYCPNPKTVSFLKTYSFIILGSLKNFFPLLKDLKIKYEKV